MMKRNVKRIALSAVSFLMCMLFTVGVYAQQYYHRSVKLSDKLSIVVSLSAEQQGDRYINGRDARLYVNGLAGLTLEDPTLEITPYFKGYKVAFRAQVKGEIDVGFSTAFEQSGFSIGATANGKVYVYKYIQDVVYFIPMLPNQECDRWGNCNWSIQPKREVE